MNEVEKMYNNAGIEKPCIRPKDLICATFRPDGLYRCTNGCYNCIYLGEYPPFTTEKQLELIKWLYQKYKNFQIFKVANRNEVGIRTIEDVYYAYGENLEDAIADFLNRNWQDLTEEERKQIRNILESEVRE